MHVSLWGSARCLLPVVLMPPTVQELQAQLLGHLLGLNTAVLFSPSIVLSIPPVDFANHPSFALILQHWHMQTCLQTHVPLYSLKPCIPALMCWPSLTAPVIKCCCHSAMFGSCHIYPTWPCNWNSGRLCNCSARSCKKTKKNPLFLNSFSRQFAVITTDPQTSST